MTVIAWLAICFNGLGVAIALIHNLRGNPPIMLARVISLLSLAFMAFMTYVGYGLLKRRNWARLIFIVVCALGIAWSALCILILGFGFHFGRSLPPDMRFLAILMVTKSILAVGMSVLFGWIIKRLCSPSVRSEFNSTEVVP